MTEKKNLFLGVGIGGIFALSLVITFLVGVLVGSKRESRFFPFWERRHVFRDYIPDKLNGHGVIGIIDSIGTNTLVVKDRTGALKTIIIDNQTRIRRGYTAINFSDLSKNDQVIVLGEPQEQEGIVTARMIRLIK